MRAITVVPLQANSAKLEQLKEPPASDGSVLVETLAVGVCGTDVEIVAGDYGWAPPGHERLVLGHESLGKVVSAPAGATVAAGDLVVGFVRRPDPVPCYACARDEWDACRNGRYTEHGIKEIDGYMREHYRADPEALVRLDPTLGDLGVLLEPTTIVAKAWEQIDAVSSRSTWKPSTVMIVGAGPIGLLAALLGQQRGLEVHVIDQVTTGVKPQIVAALGATYHTGPIADAHPNPDIVLECTGIPSLVFGAIDAVATSGVVCLTGVSAPKQTIEIDGGSLARAMVLGNKVVVGSVNANRRHYAAGAEALASADREWLARLITRTVPMERFHEALEHGVDDVKVVVKIAS